jgi:hypothetical protein
VCVKTKPGFAKMTKLSYYLFMLIVFVWGAHCYSLSEWRDLVETLGFQLKLSFCIDTKVAGMLVEESKIILVCDHLDEYLAQITIAHETIHLIQHVYNDGSPILSTKTLFHLKSKIKNFSIFDLYPFEMFWTEMEAHFLDNYPNFVYKMAANFETQSANFISQIEQAIKKANAIDVDDYIDGKLFSDDDDF